MALGLVLAAWAIDTRADDEVLRGVEVGGEELGGLGGDDLDAVIARVAGRVEDGEVRVETPDGDLEVDAAGLGVDVDERATRAVALEVGSSGSGPSRVWGWVESFWSPRATDLVVAVDEAQVAEVVTEQDPTSRREPTEPSVAWGEETARLAVVPGADGRGLD
ncbi:MAG: peptidoglycan binding domain-containing protein, partial [Acidimicrobiia bacterium]|nr:peptidoglycan binding domain-containing protein [Acidimicrobiia bacterium]